MNKKLHLKYIAAIVIAAAVIVFISVSIATRKTVTVMINNNTINFVTHKSTVSSALASKGITLSPKDKITPSLDQELSKKTVININRAQNIKINVDGKSLNVMSAEDDINSMLKAEGITLSDQDKVKPDKYTKLAKDLQVDVIRVETKTISGIEPIKFKEIVSTDRKLSNTKRKVIQEGKEGQTKITTSILLEDGKEVSRSLLSQEVVVKPTDRLVVQGTYPSMPVSRGGEILPYSKTIKVRTTAYWAVNGVGKTYTASGKKAVRNPDGFSTVAVDPSVIPFGTKLFIEGYGFATAADSGTGIKGNTIDVFFDTYKEACNWAVKYVNAYILR